MARTMVHEALTDAGRHDLGDVAELLVSELVTNAIVHARTPIDVEVLAGPEGVRVSVHDGSTNRPTLRHYSASATTGRGLELLGLLSDRYGTDDDRAGRGSGGKTVWFELGTARPGTADRPTDSVVASETGLSVVLLGLPVLLGRAWQQHADALLRELLLSRWDDEGTVGAVGRPLPGDEVAANEAFTTVAATMAEHGPVADAPAYVDLVLPLREGTAAQFAALDTLMDHVSRLAEQGQTLAPPTMPEIRLFRAWFCNQVREQAAGRPPTAWAGFPLDTPPPPRPPVTWDPSVVTTATDAVVAGDDANRILAASPAALALLGWDEDLVGQRLLAVIPRRFRDAHIASFTMQLLTGETSILGREITVPALRRDGTEVEIRLLVSRENLSDGRAVFTARMRQS